MMRSISRLRTQLETIADHGAALLQISTQHACCSCSSDPGPISRQTTQVCSASTQTSLGVRFLNTITDISAAREQSSIAVFHTVVKARHRDRAAYLARVYEKRVATGGPASIGGAAAESPQGSPQQSEGSAGPTKTKHGYRGDPLIGTVADRLLDRLEDCLRKFARVAIIGGAAIQVLDRLAGGRAGIENVTVVDSSPDMLRLIEELAAARAAEAQEGRAKPWPAVTTQLMEAPSELLPLEPDSVDLVISCLGLHWANDLPVVMAQCRFALVPDGLFLCAMFGGDTLQELRISCSVSQMERRGGVSPVVSPFAQVRDGGNLLTRAGLALPSVDFDEIVARYQGGPSELVDHLRAMGESNAVRQRQRWLGKDVPVAAAAAYQSMFGDPDDGSVPATFQVVYLTGWAPHESQQRPARRGSATVSFQDLATGLVGSGQAQGGATGEGGPEEDGSGQKPEQPRAQ